MRRSVAPLLVCTTWLSVVPGALAYEDEVRGLDWSIGPVELRMGGLLQWDTDYKTDIFVGEGQAEGSLSTDDSAVNSELRRTRFDFAGFLPSFWRFRLQWEVSQLAQDANFQTEGVDLLDAWMGFDGITDHLSFRIGNYKEPFSIERLTPVAAITTIERTPFSQLFVLPERSQGLGLLGSFDFFRGNNQFTWGLGGFTTGLIDEDDGGDQYAATGRLTYAYIANYPDVLHLGVSGSLRDLPNDRNLVDLLPVNLEVNTAAPYRAFIDRPDGLPIAEYSANDVSLYAFETAIVYGSWSAQIEWIGASFDGAKDEDGNTLSDYDPYTYYAEISWFPTGDRRNYRPVSGNFAPVEPDNFYGAVQLYYRWTRGKFKDGEFGDDVSLRSIGVNWWITDRVAFKLSWIHGWLSRGTRPNDCRDPMDPTTCDDDDTGNVVSFRAQVDF